MYESGSQKPCWISLESVGQDLTLQCFIFPLLAMRSWKTCSCLVSYGRGFILQLLLTKMVQQDSRNQVIYLTRSTWFIHMPVTQRTHYVTEAVLIFDKLVSLEYRETWQKHDDWHIQFSEGLYCLKSVVISSPEVSNCVLISLNLIMCY